MSWAKQSPKKTSRTCLQYAMWTLAVLLSAQFQHLRDSLYRETRQMLELLEVTGNEPQAVDVEQAQAWILLAIYEFMRTSPRQAWMSAGRSFRLVQLMRLHEIDSSSGSSTAEADWIEIEEKRRTFWMAYTLDQLFSIRNGWPLTLNEHVVRLQSNGIWLPCSLH
jgi:hypothetical protein